MIKTPHVKSLIWLYKVCLRRTVPCNSAHIALSLKGASSVSVRAWTSDPLDPRHWRGALHDFQLIIATVHSSPLRNSLGANPEIMPMVEERSGRFCCPASHHEAIMRSFQSRRQLGKYMLCLLSLLTSLMSLLVFRIVWTVAFGTSERIKLTSAWKCGPVWVAFHDKVPIAPRSWDNSLGVRGDLVCACRWRVIWISSIHLVTYGLLGDPQAHVRHLGNFTTCKLKGLLLPLSPLVCFQQLTLSLNEQWVVNIAANNQIINVQTGNGN